ncbi:MAG: ATP-binding protein [Caenibius sp.]
MASIPDIEPGRAIRVGAANMRQLITLRWLAVMGQFTTVMIVHFWIGVQLPVGRMLVVVGALVVLNLVSLLRLRSRQHIAHQEIFTALLLDVIALAVLLYMSGGATNPFIWLFLIQIVLSAILLDRWSAWAVVGVTSTCFVLLRVWHEPLVLPPTLRLGLLDLYLFGALTSFVLNAGLIVQFVTRINANLRAGDAQLAQMRQQAAEEDHIVRMGLLATGAAHELGTPLALLSVITNDWTHRQDLLTLPDLSEEVEDVRLAVERCKRTVSGILMAAGEPRGEKPTVTSLATFLQDVTTEWQDRAGTGNLRFENHIDGDLKIVSDITLKQVIWNVLDNALEASSAPVTLAAQRDGADLVMVVRDAGPGFAEEILRDFGKPYRSTKGRHGGGLGLFLVVNAMRKMGGAVKAHNEPTGGASVVLTLPLSAIEWTGAPAR